MIFYRVVYNNDTKYLLHKTVRLLLNAIIHKKEKKNPNGFNNNVLRS